MKERIGFASYPDFSGNSKALFEDMNNKDCIYELIWFCKDAIISKKLNNLGIKAICDKDENFIEEFNKTKIIINTHDYFMDIKKENQIFINLWHGLGPKKAGTLIDKETDWIYKFSTKNNYLIAPSEFGRFVLSSVLNINMENTKQFPQPRYKWLFENKGKENLQKLLNIDLKKYNKILMYAPTFKKGIGRNDSTFNENNLLNLKEYDEEILIDYLEKNNILLLLKMHPVEENNIKNIESDNIIKLSDDIMLENFITINEILDGIDLLISDYSSIFIDYANLERPMIFIDTDREEFEKNRGIIFDSLDFWWEAGPIVNNIEMLIKELNNLLKNSNYYKEERKKFNKLVNGKKFKTNKDLINFINNLDIYDIKNQENCATPLLEKRIALLKQQIIDMQDEINISNNELYNKKIEIERIKDELTFVRQEHDKVFKELESIKYSKSYRLIAKIKKVINKK